LLQSIPINAATSPELTEKILFKVKQLEAVCSTLEENVLRKLAGTWVLVWTAQDKSSKEMTSKQWWNNYINPLENQSYSNNPITGRINPILPRNIQDKLEKMGILSSTPIQSTQSVDLMRKRVRNVVSFQLPFQKRPSSLIVDIGFTPDDGDCRKINVKFEACTVKLSSPSVELKFPLGFIGPTGWLSTTYIDEDIRVTRGFKGSVFILSRTGKNQWGKRDD